MSEQYSKDIHTDTLRLRLLLTNSCTQKCPHCLNEYMDKYKPNENDMFMDTLVLQQYVIAYVATLNSIGSQNSKTLLPHVYLSGGEPTLHKDFSSIVQFIKRYGGSKITLCSNGNNYSDLISTGVYDHIDVLHFSFGFVHGADVVPYFDPIYTSLKNWMYTRTSKDLAVAFVTTTAPDFEQGVTELLRYREDNDNKFTIKLWGDLTKSADHPVNKKYAELIGKYPELIHRGPVEHPINRGAGCIECNRSCPTLKALWVRPNNTSSPCPQSSRLWKYTHDTTPFISYYDSVMDAYSFHFDDHE